jgi:hypothetical protein
MAPEPLTPEELEYHEKIYKPYAWQVLQVRGLIIQEIVTMERLVDAYISGYFCPTNEKRGEMLDLILSTNKITYEAKAHVVREILNREFPGKKNEHTALYKDLIYIAEERNKVAHYMIDASQDCIDKFIEDKETVSLLKFEKTRSRETFTKERIEKVVKKVHVLTEKFIDYNNRLTPSILVQGPPGKNLNED